MAIDWVFFDVGDVLFNEDAPHMLYFHSLHQAMRRNGIDVPWDRFNAQIKASVEASPSTFLNDCGRHFSDSEDRWQAIYHEGRAVYEEIRKPRPYGVLLDGVTAVVESIAADFHVGVIANQHPQILEAFSGYGISKLFELTIIDEIVGVSKPDPAIFHLALEQAGCLPEHAIMVGDRTDNDIAPANRVGMRTVRFRRGMLYAHCNPLNQSEVPFREVRDVDLLADVIREAANTTPG